MVQARSHLGFWARQPKDLKPDPFVLPRAWRLGSGRTHAVTQRHAQRLADGAAHRGIRSSSVTSFCLGGLGDSKNANRKTGARQAAAVSPTLSLSNGVADPEPVERATSGRPGPIAKPFALRRPWLKRGYQWSRPNVIGLVLYLCLGFLSHLLRLI